MIDRTGTVFGNPIDGKTIEQAEKSKAKFVRKYGDDSAADYVFSYEPIPTLAHMGVQKLVLSQQSKPLEGNPLVIGNIRMGFGHYRISIAMASCAKAMGYTPYWLDLAGFDATGSKMIQEQNRLYSMGSRVSQKSGLFNRLYWEPLNSEGFRQLTYNAKDQKNAELLVPLFASLPKDVPYIATHVWPSQAAVHAGLTHVVNAIPDNWPMALHLSEGAVHTVQTPFAYLGYKMLNGFADHPLQGMPESDLKMVGRYVDHELLANLKADNERRIARAEKGEPMRFLLTVGGAGAGYDQFLSMVKHLVPLVSEGKAAVFINFGDHRDTFKKLLLALDTVPVRTFSDDYEGLRRYVESIREGRAEGITAICGSDLFEAVYSTNLLMPVSDVLVTKPSELAYYPIPKIFMKHIGGHEVYGAVCSQEAGDGTFECPDEKSLAAMIDRIIEDKELYAHLCRRIDEMKSRGDYDGAYRCVELAAAGRE